MLSKDLFWTVNIGRTIILRRSLFSGKGVMFLKSVVALWRLLVPS
jgi:hypothetical protein